jgi:hypothetical protein
LNLKNPEPRFWIFFAQKKPIDAAVAIGTIVVKIEWCIAWAG